MRLPKYDVLIPTLFVALIFPAAAGGWWRYFSGHASEIANPSIPVANAGQPGNTLLAAHRVVHRGSAGASGRRLVVAERSAKSASDGTKSYKPPNKPQACGIPQASSSFDGFYLSAEAGE
jgi:hypothetical protein